MHLGVTASAPNLCDLLCHGSGGQWALKDKAQLVMWLLAAWAVLGLVRAALLTGTRRTFLHTSMGWEQQFGYSSWQVLHALSDQQHFWESGDEGL